ncbi:MAG: molybdopterin molybdotransferase MoeA [Chthoniobacterales bacterium]|nr:molybdopterin molybdotransferase MoeA [Chthoniobacterales bacterium]
MTTVDELWVLLRKSVTMRDSVRASLAEADGRVLREPVMSPQDQPAFDRSAVDGFVVLSSDDSPSFRVVDEIRAGQWKQRKLGRGEAMKIATGAAVPCEGCEVVMLEDAVEDGAAVRLKQRGRGNIRLRGEDASTGDILVAVGRKISAGVAGLLATAGCTSPLVTRRLSVLHVATGGEIVPPEAEPEAGQIRDANSAMVGAWARPRGLQLTQARVSEDMPALLRAIEGERDLLLVSGGSSVGGHDNTAKALAEAGFEILVSQVAVRPGRPVIVGRRGDSWAFGLPGNPLSHFVCLHLFVAAAVAAMEGGSPRPRVRNRIVAAAVAGNPRETWWPAIAESRMIRPLRWRSSGDLTSLARADALLRVPPSGIAAGDEAEFIRAL